MKQQRDINWHFNLEFKGKQLKLKLGTLHLFMCSSTDDGDDERLRVCLIDSHKLNSNDVIESYFTCIR